MKYLADFENWCKSPPFILNGIDDLFLSKTEVNSFENHLSMRKEWFFEVNSFRQEIIETETILFKKFLGFDYKSKKTIWIIPTKIPITPHTKKILTECGCKFSETLTISNDCFFADIVSNNFKSINKLINKKRLLAYED